jgi:hypothetical protein
MVEAGGKKQEARGKKQEARQEKQKSKDKVQELDIYQSFCFLHPVSCL